MAVLIKRVYEDPAKADGTRVLVDRLWPRGVSKERAALDAWLKDLAPSDELRHWYHSRPAEWAEFRRKYLKELSRPEAAEDLEELYEFSRKKKRLTLLYASSNEENNNATVLRDLLEGMRKPPTGTGPGAAGAGGGRKVRTMPRR
jgi:uncharacterized protein YeaO (DUF488 family)